MSRHNAGKEIDSALDKFRAPQSDLHRRIKKSLAALRSSHAKLETLFEQRKTKRENKATKSARDSIEAAGAKLKSCEDALKNMKEAGNKIDPVLLKFAEDNVTSAKLQLSIAENIKALNFSTMNGENDLDRRMQEWMNSVIVLSVRALYDDGSGDAAITILSGGLIAAGIVGAPAAFVAAGGSALLLAIDAKRKLNVKDRLSAADREARRIEFAELLICHVAGVAQQWLEILSARKPAH